MQLMLGWSFDSNNLFEQNLWHFGQSLQVCSPPLIGLYVYKVYVNKKRVVNNTLESVLLTYYSL